ncbi:hypothetical protein [Haloplanus aerogenes]|nr:hypothetical protein [Haloplanus aerogenes]AZH24574.1 hypothetical protein DU502_03875 [Haloplanus aerogenes]
MTRVSREAFRDCFDGLAPEDRTAFVEAVYDARGWETVRVDGDLWVTPPGADESRRVAGRGVDDADADDTVDAADLRQMVRYAVERETRERLFRQFFDCEPSDLAGDDPEPESSDDASARPTTATSADDTSPSSTAGATAAPPPTGGHRRDGTRHRSTATGAGDRRTDDTTRTPTDEARRERATEGDTVDGGAPTGPSRESTTGDDDTSIPTARWIAVGLVAVIVVGGVVAAVGPGLTSSGADGDDAARGSNGAASPDVMEREGLPIAPGVRRVEAAEGSLPPGIDSTGVTDASALADAHEAALTDQSYRLRITHREFVDGELRGVTHERAVVESPRRYRSQVRTLGAIRHESGVVAPVSTYANGTSEYVRRSGSDEPHERIEIRSRTGTGDIVDRTERAVRWYLSVNDSRIVGVGEGTTVRIAIRGDPWPASRNVTGWALVDEDGVVRELHREYTPTSAPNVRVEITIRIVPGPVTVTRPAWVDAAAAEEEANESDMREPSTPALAAPVDRFAGGRA